MPFSPSLSRAPSAQWRGLPETRSSAHRSVSANVLEKARQKLDRAPSGWPANPPRDETHRARGRRSSAELQDREESRYGSAVVETRPPTLALSAGVAGTLNLAQPFSP